MTDAEPQSLPLERLEALLDGFGDVRLLVVGDAFLDEYLRGDALRISPEAPVPVVHVSDESWALGGAANVVRNVVGLGAGCDFVSVLGEDPAGDRVVTLLEELGVDSGGIVRDPSRVTTHKTRVVARRQQVVRVDRETLEPLAEPFVGRLLARVEAALPQVAGVVLEDYAKGLFSREVAGPILVAAARCGVPVSVDPKLDLEPFKGAALLKPNLIEAEQLTRLSSRAVGGLDSIVRELQKWVGNCDVVITRGGAGMTIVENDAPAIDVPTVSREVFDVQGAGDTIISVLALARCAGASLWEAAVIANAAAGVVVGKTGTATATPDEVRAALPAVREAAILARQQSGGEG